MSHLVPILDDGVTLDRGDHVIVLPDAEPWPAALAEAVEQLLDTLGAPRRRERTEEET